ncbi:MULTISPECIES: DNA polymerase III subunit gamma/tau [Bacillus cereus group]|uniref:DNA-directed DNA polymerase n=1 Tax=Bacillus cereus 03BB108 TaxID=451709 RepID=A0AAN0SSC3_BACCE|nr:DNA polymerase III subunit gamma/tau [Bacillus cereus]AJI08813.1 DNA polymerase III, subunit gamma and tau [Bacillus cereus 03BB108]EDX59902.1 DNA polymerase III subunit gamma/tau [Bacillus cereus 03BB108]QKG99158.1 DNA polymerase III subunit gamma/tau [Bacillus cereus]HDR7254991.1 DNA polymerase III subunit gamma/tau [Bacillus pacificus]
MYQALYRKYRPSSFGELIGQNHIKQTLLNALKSNKFTHAYMLTGPRGTGKTSIGKLFAKAINCEHLVNGEPCNDCNQCKQIMNNSHPDILEIDAASNNGVEQIRDIREQVTYAPSVGKYKVYIIDEVHMLSIGAFNALLKTLEEPPKNVVFILATTDIHKVPVTIISRCQRFDFRRIGQKDLIERMKFVASNEELQIEEEALQLISMLAQGGMRDALSLLDQTVAFASGEITKNDVSEVVGRISIEKIEMCVQYLLTRNTTEILSLVNEVILNGKEPIYVLDDLIGYLRDLVIGKAFGVKEDNITTAIVNEHFNKLLKVADVSQMQHMIRKLTEIKQEMKFSNHAQISLEVGLIQLVTENHENHSLLKKITELENKIKELQYPQPQKTKTSKIESTPHNKINITDSNKTELNAALEEVNTVATKDYILNKVFPSASKKYKNVFLEKLPSVLNELLRINNSDELYAISKRLEKISVAIASLSCVVIGADEMVIKTLSQEHIYRTLCKLMQKDISQFVEVKFITLDKWKPVAAQMMTALAEKKHA